MATNTERNIIIDIQTKTNKAQADIKQLNKQLDRLSKQNTKLRRTNAEVTQMTRSFASLAQHLAKLAIIYGAFEGLNTTVRKIGEFEHSLSRLQAISNATAGEMAQLREKSLELGASTVFTSSQVVDGMNAMAMSGLNAKQQLQGVGATLNLASVGMLSLQDASLITVTAMHAFGLQASDISHITDVITVGATNSAQTVEELGNAYEKVGSVATTFGVSIEETTAALEVMADAGRRGSEAGTQLKIVMSRLAGNKEALKYIKSLGVSMYDANGNLKPFRQQLSDLKTELYKLAPAARNIKLSQIFGEEGKASAILLLNNLDKYDAKLKTINNSYGEASKKAKEMIDNLFGSFKKLMSALESLALEIGTQLTPTLRDAVDSATEMVTSLDDKEIENFGNSVAELIKVLVTLGTSAVSVVSAFAEVAGAFRDTTGVSTAWIAILGVSIYKMRGMISSLATLHPALLLVASGTVAITAALDQWQQTIDDVNKSTTDFTKVINDMAEATDAAYLSTAKMSDDEVRANIDKLSTGIDSAYRQVDKYSQAMKDISNQTFITDGDLSRQDEYASKINQLTKEIKFAKLAIQKYKEKGTELTQQRQEEIKAINEQRDAQHQLALDAQRVGDDDAKILAKQKANLASREKALENTLSAMLQREQRYQGQIDKLEADKLNIYKKYNDARAFLNMSVEERIANVRAKSLNDVGKYNNAQMRADKALAQAKEALAKGNVAVAERYYKTYNSLIEKGAGEDIKVQRKVLEYSRKTGRAKIKTYEQVAISAKQTADEYEKRVKAGAALEQQILDAKEKKELSVNKKSLDAITSKLSKLQQEKAIQKEMIDLVKKLAVESSKVKFNPQFQEFETHLQDAEAKLKDLAQKQRNIKLSVDTKSVTDKIDAIGDKDVKVKVEVDDTELEAGFTKFEKFKDGVKQPLNSHVNIVTEDKSYRDFVEITKTPLVTPLGMNDSVAKSTYNRFKQQAEKPLYTTLYIREVRVPARAMGGIIPKYNNGGYLENGIGHTRKQGALGGYGGGDKVKALLEAGEFIIRKEAVRALGLDRLHQINQGMLPKFQTGGFVAPEIPKFQTGGVVSQTSSNRQVDLNLNIGNKVYKTTSTEDIASELADYLTRSNF